MIFKVFQVFILFLCKINVYDILYVCKKKNILISALPQQEYTTTTPSRPITSSTTSTVSIETSTTKSKGTSKKVRKQRLVPDIVNQSNINDLSCSQISKHNKYVDLFDPVKSEAPQPLRILKYDNPLSWPRANEFCQSKGGSLIVLNDKSIIPEANLTSSDKYVAHQAK